MFAEVMFFLCMSQVDKFYYEPRLGMIALHLCAFGPRSGCLPPFVCFRAASLQCRSGSKIQRVDPVPFITGVATILTQVKSQIMREYDSQVTLR